MGFLLKEPEYSTADVESDDIPPTQHDALRDFDICNSPPSLEDYANAVQRVIDRGMYAIWSGKCDALAYRKIDFEKFYYARPSCIYAWFAHVEDVVDYAWLLNNAYQLGRDVKLCIRKSSIVDSTLPRNQYEMLRSMYKNGLLKESDINYKLDFAIVFGDKFLMLKAVHSNHVSICVFGDGNEYSEKICFFNAKVIEKFKFL